MVFRQTIKTASRWFVCHCILLTDEALVHPLLDHPLQLLVLPGQLLLGGGITVEVITDEIEMSSQEVTKYESIVEEIVWAGGDEGQFEYEDEDVVNGKEILIVMQLVLK